MPINPAPSLVQSKIRPTAKVADLLFFELRNSDLPSYNRPPEYGTPHPDRGKFPHHNLVFVEASDKEGFERWWYAADRTDQDDYNFSVSYPYGGDEAFPRYTRSYIIRRDQYVPLIMGSADPVYGDASLVAQKMEPMEGQIGSLYVQVTRVYDVIPGFDDSAGIGVSQTSGGYVVERPLGTLGFLKVTWTLTLPKEFAEDIGADGREDYRQCPIDGYTDLKLVDETISSPDDQEVTRTIRRVYLKQQVTPKIDRQRFTQHLEPPDQFTDFIQRETQDLIVVADVADVPDAWDTVIPTGGTKQIQSQVEMRTLLDGRKVTVNSQFEYGSLMSKVWDDNLGKHLIAERFPLPANTDLDAWVEDFVSANQFYETQAVNRGWMILTRIDMGTPGSITQLGGIVTVTNPARDYFTTKVFSWPAVLQNLNLFNLTATDGSVQTFSAPVYKEAWSGICKARVRRWWQAQSPTSIAPIQTLTPTSMLVDWPIAQVAVKECLHPAYSFEGNTASDSEYGLIEFGPLVFPATNMVINGGVTQAVDWPASLTIDFDVVPYRHGYLCTLVDVYKPY